MQAMLSSAMVTGSGKLEITQCKTEHQRARQLIQVTHEGIHNYLVSRLFQ